MARFPYKTVLIVGVGPGIGASLARRLEALPKAAARELGPKGIHVAHFNIDGGVRSAGRPEHPDHPDGTLDPDAIAQTYIDLLSTTRRLVVRCRSAPVDGAVLRCIRGGHRVCSPDSRQLISENAVIWKRKR